MKNRNKIIATMIIVTALFFSIVIFGVQSSASNQTKELKLVHVIVRHGARTPADTYPNDPYINHTFYPMGWGQLTNVGKLEVYNLGKLLRARYDAFLGPKYSADEAYTQATDTDRTKASLQLINAGLWPPVGSQRWGPLPWQPIPVHSEPLAQDSLLLVRLPCPKYHQLLDQVKQRPEIRQKLADSRQLFDELSEAMGRKVADFDDIQDVYSTLKAEEGCNLTLPAWTSKYYPEQMEKLTIFSYVVNAYTEQLNRLKGGVLLKKVIGDWRKKSEDKLRTKLFLYGGHDSTIANLLSTLKVWDPQNPGYAITILLEMSKNTITNQFGVEIFLRNATNSDEMHQLRVPGCEAFCPLDDLVELSAQSVPDDWAKECEADFDVPELGGP